MCLVEFAERASYYGTSTPFNNFLNNPLPKGGNGAGAVAPGAAGADQSAGALYLGSVKTSAITKMFSFLAYVTPIFGGIVADNVSFLPIERSWRSCMWPAHQPYLSATNTN